jgi:hypothetical protein
MGSKVEEERNKVTAEQILINNGLATRLPDDAGIVHTTKGLAAGVQNMSHQEIIDTFTAKKHLRPDQFGDQVSE